MRYCPILILIDYTHVTARQANAVLVFVNSLYLAVSKDSLGIPSYLAGVVWNALTGCRAIQADMLFVWAMGCLHRGHVKRLPEKSDAPDFQVAFFKCAWV